VPGKRPRAARCQDDDATAAAGRRQPGQDREVGRGPDVVGDHDRRPPGSAGQPVGHPRLVGRVEPDSLVVLGVLVTVRRPADPQHRRPERVQVFYESFEGGGPSAGGRS
jgi:hypothetical protein